MSETTDKKRILWLDDEPHFLTGFLQAIEECPELEVQLIKSADEALDLIEGGEPNRPDLLIWDMIMPRGRLSAEETQQGVRTGEVFFRRFREVFPNTPALLFTNVAVMDRLEPYDCPEERSWCWRKRDILPDDLVREIRRILKAAAREGG